MLLTEDAFCKIIQETWSSTLGFPVDFPSTPKSGSTEDFQVRVGVSGAWNGQVLLSCPANLGRLVAAAFFQVDAEKAGRDQILDALSEIIHIVGGNLKALLPQPVNLSLPSVHGHDDGGQLEVGEKVWSILLESEGYPFEVSLFSEPTTGLIEQKKQSRNSEEQSGSRCR